MTTQNIYALTDLWNAGGTTFKGIALDVTDTASASGSLLMDLQVGGVSQFSVQKNGLVNVPNTGANGSTGYAIGASTLLTQVSSYATLLNVAGGGGIALGAAGSTTPATLWALFSGAGLSFFDGSGVTDLILARDAANTLAQRNSTNAQAFRVYNTYTDASNYERGFFDWSTTANTLTIGTAAAGTGTGRQVAIQSASSINFQVSGANTIWSMSTSGHLLAATDNTYDIGAAAATRPRSIFAATSFISPLLRVDFINNSTNTVTYFQFPSSGETTQFVPGGTAPRLQFGGTTNSFGAIARDGAGISIVGAAGGSTAHIKVPGVTVANLPAAATAGAGARSFVTDALAPVFGSAVAGSGAVNVPVYSDGSAWNVG
jgi:hypothetical protein